MLLPQEVAAGIQEVRGEPGCNNDQRLLRSARSYARPVRQTMKNWAHCPHPSTGVRARRLLREEKRRPLSAYRWLPSSVELFSGDGLPRIEVDSSGLGHRASLGLHYRCADVADCFHRMLLSGEIRHFSVGKGIEQAPQDDRDRGNKSFAQPNSLADVLFVAHGFLSEPLLRSVRKPSTNEPTAIPATMC